jgi:hypothetical protein
MKYLKFSAMIACWFLLAGISSAGIHVPVNYSGMWVSQDISSGLLIQEKSNNLLSLAGQDKFTSWKALCKVEGEIAHCTGNGIHNDGRLFLYKGELKFEGSLYKGKAPTIKETWIVDYGRQEQKGKSVFEKLLVKDHPNPPKTR